MNSKKNDPAAERAITEAVKGVAKFPSRSKCLRALRKVYPGAEVKPFEGGQQLTYMHAGNRVPVLEVKPAPGVKMLPDAMTYAVVIAAFKRLGFVTKFQGQGLPFAFEPLKDFVGAETTLPMELDPDTDPKELAALLNAHVKAREEAAAKAGITVSAPAGLQTTPEATTSTELSVTVGDPDKESNK